MSTPVSRPAGTSTEQGLDESYAALDGRLATLV
jgi:hypothetical protein